MYIIIYVYDYICMCIWLCMYVFQTMFPAYKHSKHDARSLDSAGAGGRLWSAHSTHSTPRCSVNFWCSGSSSDSFKDHNLTMQTMFWLISVSSMSLCFSSFYLGEWSYTQLCYSWERLNLLKLPIRLVLDKVLPECFLFRTWDLFRQRTLTRPRRTWFRTSVGAKLDQSCMTLNVQMKKQPTANMQTLLNATSYHILLRMRMTPQELLKNEVEFGTTISW